MARFGTRARTWRGTRASWGWRGSTRCVDDVVRPGPLDLPRRCHRHEREACTPASRPALESASAGGADAFIDATPGHGLRPRRVASIKVKSRFIRQRPCGFHHPSALIALAMRTLSGFRPALPGRP